MKKVELALAVALGILSAPAAGSAPSAAEHQASTVPAGAALRQDLRKLWTDHVVWTRAYIVAALDDRPDAQAAAARLMTNQEDIGTAVAGVYGRPAGDRLTTLLKEHIAIAVDIVKFARAGDSASQQQAAAKWRRNGEDIAGFLSEANPHWPRATLLEMMNTHLSTTTDEVVARLKKDWAADVRAFDAAYAHILAMSDALADGIVKQFPEKFGGAGKRP